MSQTPVKVPQSAASYTPATQDADLRSQINMQLHKEGHVTKFVPPPAVLIPSLPRADDRKQKQEHRANHHTPVLPSYRIQDTLLHSLDAHPSNWPSAVQSHALTLLRTGEVTTFPALVRRVLEDVRHDTAAASAETNGETNTNGANSSSSTNGNGNGNSKNGTSNTTSEAGGGSGGGGGGSLAIPDAVVEAVLKVTRECLDAVCEVDDGSTAG